MATEHSTMLIRQASRIRNMWDVRGRRWNQFASGHLSEYIYYASFPLFYSMGKLALGGNWIHANHFSQLCHRYLVHPTTTSPSTPSNSSHPYLCFSRSITNKWDNNTCYIHPSHITAKPPYLRYIRHCPKTLGWSCREPKQETVSYRYQIWC